MCIGSRREMFLRDAVLKICNLFTGVHLCQNVISIKLPCNFIEITPRHGCCPVILLDIFRTLFLESTSERLLLDIVKQCIPENNLFRHLDFASALPHYIATCDIHSFLLFYLNVHVFSAFIAHD